MSVEYGLVVGRGAVKHIRQADNWGKSLCWWNLSEDRPAPKLMPVCKVCDKMHRAAEAAA